MALGYRRKQIQQMLLYESLFLSALSVMTTVLVSLLLTALPEILPVRIAPLQLILSICGTVVLVWLTTALSNAKLLKTDPATVLRG